MTTKLCGGPCGKVKSISDFSKHSKTLDGLYYCCKDCKREKARLQYLRRKDKHLSTCKKYREGNKEKLKVKNQEYYSLNKADFLRRNAERKAAKLQRTPPWLSEDDCAKIKDFYWLAKDLTAVTGESYHVDHIVPLQGKSVCGLHVPWNLQVLPADINLSKGNKHGNLA